MIGMPGCGKSTIGVVLAKVMGFHFIDSDLLIQERENRLLNQIIEEVGTEGFNQIENEVNSGIMTERTVVATGGSAVYGKQAMAHFRQTGVIVYLRLPLYELENRLGDLVERGISMRQGQTLRELYRERTPLYEQYAQITVDVEGLTIKDSVMQIKESFEEYRKSV